MRRMLIPIAILAIASVHALRAEAPRVEVDRLECLPNEENALLSARVEPEIGGAGARLYFRRLHPESGWYYDQLFAAGDGRYWTVFPKPEARDQRPLTDDWWAALQDRDWLQGHDRQWLADWLQGQQHEAVEYYVAVYDAQGRELGRSAHALVVVRDPQECPVSLSAAQRGWAQNLTVGETLAEQIGAPVFHWLCDGIVTRIDHRNVLRADEYCRACVVALVPPWIPASAGAVAAGVIAAEVIEDDDQPPATPSRP